MLRDLVWKATYDYQAFRVIILQYIESCSYRLEHKNYYIKKIWNKILSIPLPRRFSIILNIVSKSYICQTKSIINNEYIDRNIIDHITKIYNEALILYTDLKMEEKEYRLKLTPHNIEHLIDILKNIIRNTD